MKPNPNQPPTINEVDEDEESLSTFDDSDDENDSFNGGNKLLNGDGAKNKSHDEKDKENGLSSKRNGVIKEDVDNLSRPINKEKQITFKEPKKRKTPKSSESLPLLCLKSGISTKASPYKPSSWVNLSLTLDGRDKITKVIQYTSRFLFYYTQQDKWQKLQKSLTNSRKAYRLGRSFVELFKLYNLGFVQDILKKEEAVNTSHAKPKLLRKISSNIGYGVPTYSNLSNWSRRLSTFYSFNDSNATPSTITAYKNLNWRTICAICKLLGLMGFWFGDNVGFLITSGFLQSKRKESWQYFAARSYFFGALAGLYANFREIMEHRLRLRESKDEYDQFGDALTWEKTQCKQFSITVALLKSCCDVLVFSNNPGVDLHEKYRGRKMHEGFHCLCGFVSACTVLYNNFPNAESSGNTVSKLKKK